MIEKNDFWPWSSGPGESSIAPPNERRNSGVQSMTSGSSTSPMTSRSRQNASTRASSSRHHETSSSAAGCSFEISSRTPRTSTPSSAGAGSPGSHRGQISRAIRTISARTAAEVALGPRRGSRPAVTSGSRRVWRSLASNSDGAEDRARPSPHGATIVLEVPPRSASSASVAVVGRGPEPGQERGDVRVAGRGRCLAGRDRLVGELATPPIRFAAVSAMNADDGSIRVDASDARAPSRTAGIPSSRPATDVEPDGERRELAGEQRVDAAAEHVDPHQRVPRLLAQHVVVEPGVRPARRG